MDVFGFRVVVRQRRTVTTRSAWCMPRTSRWTGASAISSRSRRANGYQSLHTVLFGPYGSPIEVQIRTEEMDLIAERGIAAHWSYKHGEDRADEYRRAAPTVDRHLVESQHVAGSSLEFLENVKVDLFPDEVYLFTPRATSVAAAQLDRARLRVRVHTDVGNHGVAARVDRRWCRCEHRCAVARRWRSSPPRARHPIRRG